MLEIFKLKSICEILGFSLLAFEDSLQCSCARTFSITTAETCGFSLPTSKAVSGKRLTYSHLVKMARLIAVLSDLGNR